MPSLQWIGKQAVIDHLAHVSARGLQALPALAYPRVIDPSVGAASKLTRPFVRNTIVKNGPKNPISEVLLPAGFAASVASARIAARDEVWPHYLDDAEILDNKLVRAVRVASGWSSKSILQKFIAADFSPVPDSNGQLTHFVITATGAIESIKQRSQASHVLRRWWQVAKSVLHVGKGRRIAAVPVGAWLVRNQHLQGLDALTILKMRWGP